MSDLLASVERLGVRLGVTLAPGSPDYERAAEALWSASTRARSIAERAWADSAAVPDEVIDVVLSAAMRLYRNPNRFLTNQAGSFQATLAPSDFAAGDMFLAAERAVLESHKPTGALWLASTTRDDERTPTGPYDPANYVADPTNLGLGDPFYLGPIE
ncbi:hypothetical protein [Gordonia sp. OPL2]|uniref:hypothetical protein n=1 Tax=Gordonia sp. OPL2 TaxID=2486274 RepID=UPI00165613BC|nr:hypothetical protein [Gordonia sp. OPL2]RPA12626.1 hypothetical protein EEB19_05090 [Gordonia sp. OPL2]